MAAFDDTNPALYSFLYGDSAWGTLVLPPLILPPSPLLETNAPQFDGDPLFFQTQDGGDVQINNGLFLRSGGLRNAVYLSWFGANFKDTGVANDKHSWWGNFLTDDVDQHYRGQTQRFMDTTALTSNTLSPLETVMAGDVDWMISTGMADEIAVVASIVGDDRVKLVAAVSADGSDETFTFFENWNAQS